MRGDSEDCPRFCRPSPITFLITRRNPLPRGVAEWNNSPQSGLNYCLFLLSRPWSVSRRFRCRVQCPLPRTAACLERTICGPAGHNVSMCGGNRTRRRAARPRISGAVDARHEPDQASRAYDMVFEHPVGAECPVTAFDERFSYLFNSYYVGPRHGGQGAGWSRALMLRKLAMCACRCAIAICLRAR